MRRYSLLLLAAIAAWSVAGPSVAGNQPAAGGRDREAVSDVIFPPQAIPLLFSHADHLRKHRLDCAFCHEDAPESKSSLDNNMPGEDACEVCHEIDRTQPNKVAADGKPAAHCRACHPGFEEGQPVARIELPQPNLKFSHAAHAALEIRCQHCHGDLAEEGVGLATRAQLPKMSICLQCHDGTRAPSACTTCHLAEGNGLIQTAFREGMLRPSGVLRGDDHGADWLRAHAASAKQGGTYCESCHRKEYCTSCHNGSMKPLDFHGNDYVTLHTIDARRNDPDCSACHRVQTFCVGCHSRSGVAFDGKGGEFRAPFLSGDASARFHPVGWVDPAGRSASHHSFEAQRNIKQCASCHREQFCTTCHSAEPSNAFRINPHPASWSGSRRCKALAQRAGRMCLRCHVDPDEVRCE